MRRTIAIRSGGQSGVDRAALHVALELGLRYEGWCPQGGWAEDYTVPPGLLTAFPNLVETPSTDPRQRTAWNVRDSDATLILLPRMPIEESPGTELSRLCADLLFQKPWRIAALGMNEETTQAATWLRSCVGAVGGSEFVLNVGGPRESEAPGVHARAKMFLLRLLEARLGLD